MRTLACFSISVNFGAMIMNALLGNALLAGVAAVGLAWILAQVYLPDNVTRVKNAQRV